MGNADQIKSKENCLRQTTYILLLFLAESLCKILMWLQGNGTTNQFLVLHNSPQTMASYFRLPVRARKCV